MSNGLILILCLTYGGHWQDGFAGYKPNGEFCYIKMCVNGNGLTPWWQPGGATPDEDCHPWYWKDEK